MREAARDVGVGSKSVEKGDRSVGADDELIFVSSPKGYPNLLPATISTQWNSYIFALCSDPEHCLNFEIHYYERPSAPPAILTTLPRSASSPLAMKFSAIPTYGWS